jgi:hypothetical protein
METTYRGRLIQLRPRQEQDGTWVGEYSIRTLAGYATGSFSSSDEAEAAIVPFMPRSLLSVRSRAIPSFSAGGHAMPGKADIMTYVILGAFGGYYRVGDDEDRVQWPGVG